MISHIKYDKEAQKEILCQNKRNIKEAAIVTAVGLSIYAVAVLAIFLFKGAMG